MTKKPGQELDPEVRAMAMAIVLNEYVHPRLKASVIQTLLGLTERQTSQIVLESLTLSSDATTEGLRFPSPVWTEAVFGKWSIQEVSRERGK